MLKKIAQGYKKLFSSAVKVFMLLALCIALALLLVLPLWKWASTSPQSYTLVLSICIILALLFLLVRAILHQGAKTFFMRVTKLLVLVLGIALSVYFVFKSNRFLALVVLLCMFALYGMLAFGWKNEK